uniref:LY-6/neurotoxin-like protein 1 n=1 Tax=Clonorchis sinensis TaxID=79923 RepID=A0A7T8IM86_CLOSI|nr:LY-6/neurotoxin-like protein 1 [Clonorchis sinensis]
MISLMLTTLLLAAIAAEEEEKPMFECYQTHDMNFTKDSSSTHPNCIHCVYDETLHDGQVVAVSRMCVGKQCVSYNHVFEGYGQNRICCSEKLCNVDKETGMFSFVLE